MGGGKSPAPVRRGVGAARFLRGLLLAGVAGIGSGALAAGGFSQPTDLVLAEAAMMLGDSDPAYAMEAAAAACLSFSRDGARDLRSLSAMHAMFAEAGWDIEKSGADRTYRKGGVTVVANYEELFFSCILDHRKVRPATMKAAIDRLARSFAEPGWEREEKMASCLGWYLPVGEDALFAINLTNHARDDGTCLAGRGTEIEVSYGE